MKNKGFSWLFVPAVVLPAFLFAHSAYGESSVWKVSQGEKRLYIGGTIHVLSHSDYPLPEEFDKAYNLSEKLVLETDMQKMRTIEFQRVMLYWFSYPEDRNLRMDLSEATFRKLEKHLSDRGIPIESLMNFRPVLVGITLVALEMERLGIVVEGVDDYFFSKALSDHKGIEALETVYEQMEFLFRMADGREDEFIEYSLSDVHELAEMQRLLTDAWRRGDNEELEEISLIPFKNDFPEIYDFFVVGRNNAWVSKIETLLETEEVELVLVGAAHLAGDDGILAQLAARGYKIQQL